MAQNPQLGGIAAFVATARAGSFTQAAQDLGLTKSGVGKSVAKLEERLGVKLFYRTTRSLSLTPDGDGYLASCSRALDEIRDADAALMSRRHSPSGRLRIDMPAAFGRRILLPVLLQIASANPDLRLSMTFSDKLIDPVEEGVDLVVRFGETQDCSGLVSRKLAEQGNVIVASPDYLRRHGTPESLDDLATHRCLLGLRRDVAMSWTVGDGTGGCRRIVPPATHEIGDGDAIVQAVLAGLGLAQMPSSLVRSHVVTGELVPVLEHLYGPPVAVHALWPRTRHLLPKVRFVVDDLVRRGTEGAYD